MRLADAAAVVRRRAPLEAVDLGFLLARRNARALALAWLASFGPVALAVIVALRAEPWWALFLLWWLVPLFEGVPLFVLSRAFFGASPTLAQSLRALPRCLGALALPALLAGRLLPGRSFVAPVRLLEGSRGRAARARAGVLSSADGGAEARVAWLTTLACAAFEVGLLLACWTLFLLAVPESAWASLGLGDGLPAWAGLATCLAYVLVATLVAPCYAAAGFALYLNRRVELEGWDLELAFRGIAARLVRGAARRRWVAGAALLLLAGGSAARPAAAGVPQAEPDPAAAIAEVLSRPEFDRIQRRLVLEPDFELDSGIGAIVAPLFELLMWSLFAALAVGAIWWLATRREAPAGPRERARPRSPATLFGLDLRSEALPADVPAAALALCEAGRAREALGLLYRAAIARLIEGDGLELAESDTERDCLERVRALAQHGRAGYFATLTERWQRSAYARRDPARGELRELCAGWGVHFGGGAA